MLMAPAKRRAIWAIYVWCRRTDELVDGPQAQFTSEKTLDRWGISAGVNFFAGYPVDDEDVALVDTLEHFPPGYPTFSRHDCRTANGPASLSLRDV